MKIEFADTFFESLKKMINRDQWYYKIWDTFRYDIPRLFSTLWWFRKELYTYYSFDWNPQFRMFRRGLERLERHIRLYGIEEDDNRKKKLQKMQRAIFLMKIIENEEYLDVAQKQLGYDNIDWSVGFTEIEGKDGKLYEMNENTPEQDEVIKLGDIIECECWDELFRILKGQDEYFITPNLIRRLNNKDNIPDFDGSGIKSWWS